MAPSLFHLVTHAERTLIRRHSEPLRASHIIFGANWHQLALAQWTPSINAHNFVWQRLFLLSLLSRKFDDRLNPNFHRFVILCICWDTPNEKTGLRQLPIVSSVFKETNKTTNLKYYRFSVLCSFFMLVNPLNNPLCWTRHLEGSYTCVVQTGLYLYILFGQTYSRSSDDVYWCLGVSVRCLFTAIVNLKWELKQRVCVFLMFSIVLANKFNS